MYSEIEVLNPQRKFDSIQKERLGNYIYTLKDPRDNKVFYVGQGAGDRVFSHLNEAEELLKGNTSYNSKRARIVDIWHSGENVEWLILSHSLPDESVDHVESAVINALEVSQNGQCLNIIGGPRSSLLSEREVKALSASAINPNFKIEKVFIFPTNNALEASAESVYQSTRASWRVNKKYFSGTSYAVGVKDGISIGSFKINEWVSHGEKSAFNGVETPELNNFNWRKIISSASGYWQRGNYLIVEFDGAGKFRIIHGRKKHEWEELA